MLHWLHSENKTGVVCVVGAGLRCSMRGWCDALFRQHANVGWGVCSCEAGSDWQTVECLHY